MSADRSLSFHRITLIALGLLALILLSRDVLTPALHTARAYLASESKASARRDPSDAGGQTASPNPSGGFDQEERVRQLLAQQ
ncbi:MAG: hypothetical protein HY741_21900 [Chloroflexi bacterium]|nr:hypothetical protein [Chloroflexota bacterium]